MQKMNVISCYQEGCLLPVSSSMLCVMVRRWVNLMEMCFSSHRWMSCEIQHVRTKCLTASYRMNWQGYGVMCRLENHSPLNHVVSSTFFSNKPEQTAFCPRENSKLQSVTFPSHMLSSCSSESFSPGP